MAIDVNDFTTPTDTDPVGSPSNGIQVHMREVKKLLKLFRDRFGIGTFPDVQSSWQTVSATWRNLNTTSGGPTTLLKGLGISAVTRVGLDTYDLTLTLPLLSTNIRYAVGNAYATDGTDAGMWNVRVRTINSSTVRVSFYNLPSGALTQPAIDKTLFFSLQVAN